MKTAAVFVHGLFLNGAEFTLLRRRLDARPRFRVPSLQLSARCAARWSRRSQQLAQFVERIDAERMHFVGHSLGGIVLRRYFETRRDLRAGPRGVPGLAHRQEQRSARARGARLPVLRRMIGPLVDATSWCSRLRAARMALQTRARHASPAPRPWDWAGSSRRFDEDCDGTVGVSETKLPGHTAHLTLPVSHMGMLMSADVARQVGEFLERGFSSRHVDHRARVHVEELRHAGKKQN